MRWFACTLVGLLLVASCLAEKVQQEEEGGILDCMFKPNAATCAGKRVAKEIDRIEVETVGNTGEIPMSKIIEDTGSLIADGIQAVFGPEEAESAAEEADAPVGE